MACDLNRYIDAIDFNPHHTAFHVGDRYIAANDSSCPRRGCNSLSGRKTDNIEPLGNVSSNRPLHATSHRASLSEKTPAKQAATYSPRLLPIIAKGLIPHETSSSASAYSTTKRAGKPIDARVSDWVADSAPSALAKRHFRK